MIIQDENILRQVSKEISPVEEQEVYQKLINEVIIHPYAVGLSAIQIGLPLRAFITLDEAKDNDPFKQKKWTYWINPKIEEIDDSGIVKFVEGCLSFPGREVLTSRPKQITVSSLVGSERKMCVLTGTDSVVFQHELDHLDGKLMFDRGEELHSPYVAPPKMIGRNDPCSCGSGKKFKKCCGK